jgi:hypothetical protein
VRARSRPSPPQLSDTCSSSPPPPRSYDGLVERIQREMAVAEAKVKEHRAEADVNRRLLDMAARGGGQGGQGGAPGMMGQGWG